MGEKVKDKDAEAAHTLDHDELQKGLEDTFPASDPVSPLQPGDDRPNVDKSNADKPNVDRT